MAVDLSKTFIDRPIFAAVVSIAIFIAGVLAIPNLPITEYPEVVPPTVQVTAFYPGANPQTASETVAAPLEEAINGVENMIYMKSVAASNGMVQLTITFATGTDADLASVLVQNRVSQAVPRLPEAVRNLGVTTVKASSTITMFVQLSSPDGTYDNLYLSNYATLRVRDEMARLPGVGDAQVFGAGDYSMRVWLDPEKAASRDLSAGDIVRAIREQNVQVSAGVIGGPPQPGESTLQMSINAQGRLTSIEEFGEIVIKTAPDGAITRLRDIARIELGAESYATRMLLDGEPTAGIAIFETPGANSIAISNAVRERMAELSQAFPDGLEWSAVYDPTVFVRESISAVIMTLLEAVLLVVIVVVLFLQTWRASIIPLLAVPVSIIGTFAVLWLLGFSINVLTLFGLVLAVGIVVDDAIVVVENVERHIEDGFAPRVAAHRAMEEVSGPIVAISLVLASVFVPLAFLGSVTGAFYQQFAVTIAASVLISGLNSLTLSPAMAAILLKPSDAPKDALGNAIEKLFGWIFRPFNRVFTRGAGAYSRGVGANLGRGGRMLVIYSVLIFVAVLGFRSVPAGFVPEQDKQYLFGVVLMPEGATIDRTEAVIREMARIGEETPGVDHSVALPGLNGVHFVPTPNVGTVFFTLDPDYDGDMVAAELAQSLSFQFSEIKEGLAFAFMPPPVFGLSNTSGLEMYVQDRADLGFGELNNNVQAFSGVLRQTPGFDPFSVLTSYQSNVPQLDAAVDRRKAKEQGLLLTDIFDALQVYLGSAYINDFNLFGRTYSVYVQADAEFRDDISDISRIKVRNQNGGMIPITSVLDISQGFGPDPVVRYNGYPAADVTAGFNPAQLSSAEALTAASSVAASVLPQGMTLEWTGLTYQEAIQGNMGLLVFPLCIILVFLVLAALYESWSLPLAVILIVPMCLLSAIGGIWLLNTIKGLFFGLQIGWGMIPPPPMSLPPTFLDNNIFTQIGLVVLMGLACKNAILIVEFARDLEKQGRSILEAAVEASRLRLRPILMTSFSFCAGVLPLVFASGAGAEVRHVMGVTVLFGMLGVTFFGLFFTPVFYVGIRSFVERRKAGRVNV